MAEGPIENYCDLPYGAEYAKSNHSTCRRCKEAIGKATLRLSAREPSRFFDGIQDNWYHVDCFFKILGSGEKINEKSIRGIEVLRWDDQERIRRKIVELANGGPIVSDFESFKAEYSKTNKGKCYGCKKFFEAQELKIGKKNSWYHHGCVLKSETDVVLEGEPDQIVGFDKLKEEDQAMLRKTYGKKGAEEEVKAQVEVENIDAPCSSGTNHNAPEVVIDGEAPPPKKYRFAMKNATAQKDPKQLHKEQMKRQTDIMWDLRQELEKLNRNEKKELLTANELMCPESEEDMLELLVDSATFGKPLRCPKCNTGEVIFSLSARTYSCLGYMSEYLKCPYTNKNPVRSTFKIPKEMEKKLYFLSLQKLNVLTSRTYPLFEEEEEVVDRDKAFSHLGARQLKNVGEAYVVGKKERKSTTGQRLIKMGTVVDAESAYACDSHVQSDASGSLLSVELSKSDVISNINSYYRMQLLKNDNAQVWYLFRSWGRVGTDIGSCNDQRFWCFPQAVEEFIRIFEEKTGNNWNEKDYFQKKPGLFDLVHTDYSELLNNSDAGKTVAPGSKTKLPEAVKEVVMMISDVEAMKKELTKFRLDTTKMPLGKLSKQQLNNAYSVLTELQNMMIETDKPPLEKIYDLTNRFYTLVPHDFGMKQADVLNNLDIIKEKCRMIDALMDFQLAFKVANKGKDLYCSRDPVDVNYENLKCAMEPIDPTDATFKHIEEYFVNTHGRTHGFKIKISDVLRLDREGEDEKFMKDLGNRKLLWHGSRTTNFMGILSQGLRIAPPEAPASGYMFGKGVYFADMVSKSVQYCRLDDNGQNDGLILLCDVALGNMQEEKQAKYILKPNEGFSSVKGLGLYYPTDKIKVFDASGYEFSYGKTATVADKNNYQLHYNEYIVYNTDQIRMRYLVRFTYGGH